MSLEGFKSPSTTLPVSRSTTTMSEAFILSYSTPDGLMTTSPFSRSMAETFPHVKMTRLCFTKSKLARNTFSLSSSSILFFTFLLFYFYNLKLGSSRYIRLLKRYKAAPRLLVTLSMSSVFSMKSMFLMRLRKLRLSISSPKTAS